MKRILLNADIGERGPDHPVDRALMDYLDIANIACGGHAGDLVSVAAFTSLAAGRGITVAAHLSYPDREGFGRKKMALSFDQLIRSLDEQLALMPETRLVKFHGALYHDSVKDEKIASDLCEWMRRNEISSAITLEGSELSSCCKKAGITVIAEAFAERRYACSGSGRIQLVGRDRPDASITDLEEAVRMVRAIVEEGRVPAFIDEGGSQEVKMAGISADTICIHSDSAIALDLARAARELLDAKYGGRHGGG